MKDYPDFDKLAEHHLPCPDNYGGCDFIDTEHEECVVLLDGFCPVCGKKICIEEDETEPTPEECWQAFKQYYPGDYEVAVKRKHEEEMVKKLAPDPFYGAPHKEDGKNND